jgi:hypothetical protein
VKGVGLGRGVSATTRLSGVGLGFLVDVANGIRVEGKGVELPPLEVQEVASKKREGSKTLMAER